VGILNLMDAVLYTTTPPVNGDKARWWQWVLLALPVGNDREIENETV
jgi:hypothetical protein